MIVQRGERTGGVPRRVNTEYKTRITSVLTYIAHAACCRAVFVLDVILSAAGDADAESVRHGVGCML